MAKRTPRRRICPRCGIENQYIAKFCSDCGYHFPSGVAVPVSEPSEVRVEIRPPEARFGAGAAIATVIGFVVLGLAYLLVIALLATPGAIGAGMFPGIIPLICMVYLVTRKNRRAKIVGWVMTALWIPLIIMFLMVLAA